MKIIKKVLLYVRRIYENLEETHLKSVDFGHTFSP